MDTFIFSFWNNLEYKKLQFNDELQCFNLIISDSLEHLKLPSMQIYNITKNHDNTLTIDLRFRKLLPEVYQEVKQLEDKIIEIIYNNSDKIFRTQISKYKLSHLFHGFIHLSENMIDPPFFRVITTNEKFSVNDWVIVSFYFNKLLMKQTYCCLDLIDLELELSNDNLFDNDKNSLKYIDSEF